MTSQIENFFVEVEILIELQLRNKLQNQLKNQLEVKQKFKVGKRLIDELLDEDDVELFEPFELFRYKYHTKYAIYLEAIGEIENANREKGFAKLYDKREKNSKVDIRKKTEPVPFTGATSGNINKVSDFEENPKKNSMQDSVEKHLKVIQNILEDKIIEDIRQVFEKFDEIPETLEDYQNMVNSEIDLLKILNNFINDMSISNDMDQVLESLESLKKSAIGASYSRRILFIQFVLNSPNRKEILYSNISFTEEGVRKRFGELDQYFHQPYQLLSKDKNLGDELFEFIQEYKEILLSELESASKNENDLTFHEKKANELWKITIDYRNAAKGQWDKLKLLNKEDIKNYKRDELEHHSMTHGILACQEYQAACKIVDKAKQLKKQAKLRGNMALCLYISNNFFEAQLYALSAIVLLLKNSHEITQQDLIEAKKIFDGVKGGNGTEETVKLNSEIDLKDDSDNTPALMKVMDHNSINDDLAKLGTELIFSPSRSLIRYQASTEKHALTCKASEIAIRGGIAIESAISIAIVGISSILFMGGPATLALGICSGIKLWKVHTAVLLEEKKIREKLNQIMINTLNAYDKGEHQKFLDALSEEYATNTSLLKLGKCDDFINPENIIDKLLAHGFRSDAIAYLLNLLGEVLNGGKLKIEGITSYKLKALTRYVFNAVLSEKLKAEAKKLDDRICELRKKHQINSLTQVKGLKEYMDDAQEMSFQSRLEEMCNIARINLAIVDLVHGGYDQIERAVETIKEFRDLTNSNYQLIKWGLEVLDDLLWIIRC